ncbi:CG11637 [Drosophila busckii]|uniref:CG11637 n=1 Tax=Drosophila busckii TaxID=30019 RepID=A0A0M3QWB0_DROBS|nr:CG11637 [Drosophila busckii]
MFSLARELILNALGNGAQLHVGGALVDGADLGVTIEFLLWEVAGEANAAHPVNALGGSALSHLRGKELGHGRLLLEGHASLLHAGCVVGEQTSSLNLCGNCGNLVLHGLEVVDGITELLALQQIRNGDVKGALGKTNHLSANTNATLVQESCCILVAMAEGTQNVLLGHAHIVEGDHACTRGADAQLILRLVHNQTGSIAINNEGGNATIFLQK